MEQLAIVLEELYRKSKRSSLARSRSQESTSKAGNLDSRNVQGQSANYTYADVLDSSYKNDEGTVSLPLVTKTYNKFGNTDRNNNKDEDRYRLSIPKRQRSDNDVVIVQLFTEKYDTIRQSATLSLRPTKSYGMISPLASPVQQRRQIPRVRPPPENVFIPSIMKNSTQNADTKKKQKLDVATSGFTQAELKIHTDREKQKSNSYVLSEQERSRRIVEDWLKTLPS